MKKTDMLFQKAAEHYHTGNLREAENLCVELLMVQSDSVNALHLLGVIYYQLHDYDSAISCIDKSIQLGPANAEAYYNLGNSFKAKGQLDEAINSYHKALQNDPKLSVAYYNLATVLQDKGQLEEAVVFYRKALENDPNLADGHYNIGIIHEGKNRIDESIVCYKNAITLDPCFADAYYGLGYAFHKKGQIDEAISYYQKTIEISPDHSLSLYNLGTAFQEKRYIEKAISCYQRALQIDPNLVGVYYNLGTIYQERKQFDEALRYYRKASELNPNVVDPHYNIGLVLQEQGRLGEALASYDRAIEYAPHFIQGHWARCMAQLPIIHPDQASIEISRTHYRKELLKLRDTISLETPHDRDAAAGAVGKQQPFYLPYQGLNDRDLQQLYGELVCGIMSARYPQFARRPALPSCSDAGRLRVGIVSGFFYYHAAWKIPLKGWIKNLDRSRFQLHGYYTGVKKDLETDFAKRHFNHFVEDIHAVDELCQIIRNDNLNVLIFPEIGMDPVTVRLAALRLAPIQCTSWGHPETSGLPTIDYFLSSEMMEPPDADEHYSEKLVRLPNLSFYYMPMDVRGVDLNRDTFGLRPQSVLYHCCQSLYKHLPQHDEVFPRIAQEVGDCQFLFVSYPNIRPVVEQFRSRIALAFERFHMDAKDYVVFLPPLAPEQYQGLNGLADVYLDTIGWSGCNSILEALSCNLPVVTLPSLLMRGREGLAIFKMMGMTETVAETLDEYIALAVRLGKVSGWRKEISDKIAVKKQLVYYDKDCIRGLEDFLQMAVEERLERTTNRQ
jgi:protein O-GlcNAc transferase